MTRDNKLSVAVVGLGWAMLSTPAFAYLDPGTGSTVMAVVLSFFAAIAFTCRKYFYKLLRLFRKPSDDSGRLGDGPLK